MEVKVSSKSSVRGVSIESVSEPPTSDIKDSCDTEQLSL